MLMCWIPPHRSIIAFFARVLTCAGYFNEETKLLLEQIINTPTSRLWGANDLTQVAVAEARICLVQVLSQMRVEPEKQQECAFLPSIPGYHLIIFQTHRLGCGFPTQTPWTYQARATKAVDFTERSTASSCARGFGRPDLVS